MKTNTSKLHVKSGDTVVVISGKFEDKGKIGKINKAFPATGRVIVEGVHLVKRHQKARTQQQESAIITKEAAIDASNVMLICPKCKKATRIAHKLVKVGEKTKSVRVCKKCGAQIDG